VLLLRQAGVNARYVTGYAVPESERHGDTYLVRERIRTPGRWPMTRTLKLWDQIDNHAGGLEQSAGSAAAVVGTGAKTLYPICIFNSQVALEQNFLRPLFQAGCWRH